VFAPPVADSLSTSNPPGVIYGTTSRLYATTPSLDVSSRRSALLEPVPQTSSMENTPVDHILFNETGALLAVIDTFGTITIWEQDTLAAGLVARSSFRGDDGENDSASRVVYLRWLHNDSKLHVAVKLQKSGDQWNAQSVPQRGCGPCNSVGKESFLCITEDGRV
jgi:hypothetical protein